MPGTEDGADQVPDRVTAASKLLRECLDEPRCQLFAVRDEEAIKLAAKEEGESGLLQRDADDIFRLPRTCPSRKVFTPLSKRVGSKRKLGGLSNLARGCGTQPVKARAASRMSCSV